MIFVYVIVAIGLVCLGYGFLIEPTWLRVRHVKIKNNASTKPYQTQRIIFLSDLHLGNQFTLKRLNTLLQKIEACQPDFILLGGDFVEEKTPFTNIAFTNMITLFFTNLVKLAPTYAIMGNHDVESDANETYVIKLFNASGVVLLRNESVCLNSLIQLEGLADAFHECPCPSARNSSRPQQFRIALMHEPDYLPAIQLENNYDLVLSGHSHNGQVTLFGYPFRRVGLGRKYIHGVYSLPSGTKLITSSGIGTVHIHARFFARPEIWTIEI